MGKVVVPLAENWDAACAFTEGSMKRFPGILQLKLPGIKECGETEQFVETSFKFHLLLPLAL